MRKHALLTTTKRARKVPDEELTPEAVHGGDRFHIY